METAADPKFKKVISTIKPSLDSAWDAVCLLDAEGRIVHMNLAMRHFLGIRMKDLSKRPVFCDLVKLAACSAACQIEKAIKTGGTLRLGETPATRGSDKLRIMLSATPIFDPDQPEGAAIGAIVNIRDTTAEVLVQAKYQRLMSLLQQKNVEISQLTDRCAKLATALRRARGA